MSSTWAPGEDSRVLWATLHRVTGSRNTAEIIEWLETRDAQVKHLRSEILYLLGEHDQPNTKENPA